MVKPVSQAPNLDDIARFTISGNSGDVVYKEGDTGKDMFIIQEGKIEIAKTQVAEALKPTVLGPGDFFGELALFDDQRRDTSAKGLTPYRLLRIDRTILDQLVQENPEIAVRMLYRLASRLREHEDALRRASEIAAGAMNPLPVAVAAPAVIPATIPPPAAASQRGTAPGTQPIPKVGPARLVHTESGTAFTLADTSVVGRFDRSSGFTPEVDLTELDTKRTLSRRHASIARDGDAWYLSEPKPTGNGTFVNDARVGAGARVKLSDGDRVRFGLVETVFSG